MVSNHKQWQVLNDKDWQLVLAEWLVEGWLVDF
jgi:hypothetical protein